MNDLDMSILFTYDDLIKPCIANGDVSSSTNYLVAKLLLCRSCRIKMCRFKGGKNTGDSLNYENTNDYHEPTVDE